MTSKTRGTMTGLMLLLAAGADSVGNRALTVQAPQTPTATTPQKKAATEPAKPEAPRVRTDRHGDPLPDGAIARLGTVRWRHGLYVHDLAYSPDGTKIAAVGPGRALTLWDAATGKEIHPFPNRHPANAVAFSPDGKILATSGTPACHLWDVATGKELRQLKGHTEPVRGLVFAPDGKTLATVGGDGTARIWDAKDGKELRQLDCKQGYLKAVAFSPDGKFLATAGKDGTIRLWNPVSGKIDRQLNGHKYEVWKLVFSPDGTRLASSGADGTVRLWDVATARKIRIFGEKLGKDNLPIAFSPDGTILAAGVGDRFIRLWDVANGTQKRQWEAGAMNVRALVFSPDGKTLASGAAWEGIRLWDAATGRERHPSEEHLGVVELVRFSTDGASLVSISRERRMVWWDLARKAPRRQFTWGEKGVGVSQTALSPDGNILAEGSWSDEKPPCKVCLWDLRTGKLRRSLGEPQSRFWALAFSSDGRLAVSGGSDRIVHIWDVRTGVEVRRITGNALRRKSLCFSPDGKVLACAWDRNGNAPVQPTIQLWDISSGKERYRIHCPVSVFALAFSADGKVLASGDSGSPDSFLVRLWDAATGRELSCHAGHRGDIASVAFSPDGKLAASGAGNTSQEYSDNSVHVWEAATGRLIRRFEGQHSSIASVAFSPDGLAVASGAGDSTILLWDITGRRMDGRWQAKPLTPRQLEACWTALTNEDAAKAYDAVWALVAASEQALPFLRKHLSPASRPDATLVAGLIGDLDSEDFRTREKATEDLGKLGDAAAPALRQALEGKPTLEMRRRLQQLLDQSRDWTPERLREHRAIQALEHIGTPQAKEVLQALTGGAEGIYRTEAAREALQRFRR